MDNHKDEELIADYLKGNEKAFEVLIARYLKPIYGFAHHYVNNDKDAEDIAQDVFVKVWRNLKKFNREKNFKSWIFQITKNTCLDFLKKKRAVVFSAFETEDGHNMLAETIVDAAPIPSEIALQKESESVLQEAVQKLAPQYREVFSLRYDEDHTFKMIAELLKEPLNTVKSRYLRAIGMLRNILAA
ncbi:MAG: sigma-70 family RNA polymerase sigma factor [bacterium]